MPEDPILELIAAQEALLREVAAGTQSDVEAAADYRWRHLAIANALRLRGAPCYCPWETVFAWTNYVAKRFAGDVEAALGLLWTEVAKTVGPKPDAPKWRLVPHPAWERFVKSLAGDEQLILDEMLLGELAVHGMVLQTDRTKLEKCDCDAGGKVWEYKIQIENRRAAYKIRVFVETRPDYVFVLLHGLNKLRNDDERNQQLQKEVACDRRGQAVVPT